MDQLQPPPQQREREREPYPKMIIACIVLTVFLLMLIGSVLLVDFALRSSNQQRVQPSSPNFFKPPPPAPVIPPLEPGERPIPSPTAP